MKQISVIIQIIIVFYLKFANSESSCQLNLISMSYASTLKNDEEVRQITRFQSAYVNSLQSNSYINLTLHDMGYVMDPRSDFSTFINGMLEHSLSRYYDKNKFNLIIMMSCFDYYEDNVVRWKYYKDLAQSKNALIYVAAFGDRWYKKDDGKPAPYEGFLQLTKAENLFYRQNPDDLKDYIVKMFTNICDKFQRCGVFPTDTVPNVLDSGDCNDIEIKASCTPTCKKLFRPNSSIFCNSGKVFEIKDFKCVRSCIEKPIIENATEDSLRKCAENNNKCNIVCTDGYEYKAQLPVCDESNAQWKLSSSKCEIKKFEINGSKCEPPCIEKPSIDNATEESLRKCAQNNKECNIVCEKGYEFNRRPPVWDETKGGWISHESQCKKSNLNLIILIYTVNSLSILSFFVAIIGPDFLNVCCVRKHVIDAPLSLEFDVKDNDTDITDPVIDIHQSI